MNKKSLTSKIVCALIAVIMALSASACSDKGKAVPKDGYELSYVYNDGYKAKLKTTDNTKFLNNSTDNIGNQNIHLTTEKAEQEVQEYYDEYFATLVEVELKDQTDDTIGYFDESNRLIIYNLVVWTADGKTNYKMSCAQCEDITNNTHWKLKE